MRKTGGEKSCANCGKPFHVPAWREKQGEVKFCSMACLWEGRKPRIKKAEVEVICEQCGKPYFVPEHRVEKTRFCSSECVGANTSKVVRAARAERLRPSQDGFKVCSICGIEKPLSEFFTRPETKDGLRDDCKACVSRRGAEWRANNPERKKQTGRAYYEREAERINREDREWYASLSDDEKAELAARNKEYREKNAEAMAEKRRLKRRGPEGDIVRGHRRADYRRHKPKYVAAARAREERIKRATPPWADLKAIERFYVEADRLTRETGVTHHVDHFYPLVSKVMCGLHVEANLRVVPAAVNLRKGNKIEVVSDWRPPDTIPSARAVPAC